MRAPPVWLSRCVVVLLIALAGRSASAQPGPGRDQVLATLKRATAFMVDKAGYQGGYVWTYTADLSRRWGEMEAFPTMMWLQGSGSNAMGHVYLDLYHATKDEYYYEAAKQVGDALIRVQHSSGGWNYIADLSGEDSLKKWYETIGKNGWRLEEFQHYYGNATFDDGTTTDTARFMMRLYFEKQDPKYKASLDRAIQFVLDSQYPVGGWPQRFPVMDGFSKGELPDYSGYITFNDDVAVGNIDFLIQCYRIFGDPKYIDAIHRGMNAFVVTQQPAPQAGWGLQHDPKDLKPAGARTYEPKSLVTTTTVSCINAMIRFYQLTGDRKFLERLPEAIDWLDSTRLPPNTGGRGSHARFVELGTNKPLFVHRTGSNVTNGRYFADYDPQNTIGHYSSFATINTEALRARLAEARALELEQAMKDSPLRADAPKADPAAEFRVAGGARRGGRGGDPGQRAAPLIGSIHEAGYWLTPLGTTSNPYVGPAPAEVPAGDFGRSQVGDRYDTSPYNAAAAGGQAVMGISTQAYIANMRALIAYLETVRP